MNAAAAVLAGCVFHHALITEGVPLTLPAAPPGYSIYLSQLVTDASRRPVLTWWSCPDVFDEER